MDHFLTTEIMKVPFCALDFETTQVMGQPGELAIIEIGAQHFTGDGVQGTPFESLVNPNCKIRPFDTGVSGISDNMVSDQSKFKEVCGDFFTYIKGRVLVAHNAPFDKRALKSQCQRDKIEEPDNIFIDTAVLLKKTIYLPKYNLQTAVSHFKLETKQLHRALGDCLIVVELFRKIIQILRAERGIVTFKQMRELLGIKLTQKSEQLSLF